MAQPKKEALAYVQGQFPQCCGHACGMVTEKRSQTVHRKWLNTNLGTLKPKLTLSATQNSTTLDNWQTLSLTPSTSESGRIPFIFTLKEQGG